VEWREGLSRTSDPVSLRPPQEGPGPNIEPVSEHRDRRTVRIHPGRTSVPRGGGVCRAQYEDILACTAGIRGTYEGCIRRLPQRHAVSEGNIGGDAADGPAWRTLDAFRPDRLRLACIRTATPNNRLALCGDMDGNNHSPITAHVNH
jgi:hypothetical protein